MALAENIAPARAATPPPVAPDALLRRRREAAAGLAAALARRLSGEVRFDTASRALYATDLSIYRQVPIGVVIPKHVEDVEAALSVCREHRVPVLPRGCGTSLSGQTCNVAVVLDFSKYMNRILALDPDGRQVRVEPGAINDQVREAAHRYWLTFAPDPATHAYCTIGGNIGNNSCGAHTVMGGKTVDNVEELDILTYDGLRMRVGATSEDAFDLIVRGGGRRAEIYRRLKHLAGRQADEIRRRYPQIPRRVSGYNLDDLLPEKGFNLARALVGSEGTCAVTLAATLRLIPWPSRRALLLLGYPDLAEAADDVGELRGLGPDALEAFDGHVVENMKRKGRAPSGAKLLPEGRCWLLVEFGGDTQKEANGKAQRAFARLKKIRSRARGMRLLEEEQQQTEIWQIREAGVGASRIPGEEEAWPSWEDAAVPPERLGDYLRDFAKLNQRYGYRATVFGHFGDGCVHARMTFGLKTAQGVARFRAYMEEAADLCLSYGGSLSGEHGDGQAKGELLPKMFGADLVQAFREFKTIWDPEWRMNPGKLIDADPLDRNLRLGPDYEPRPVHTHFRFPADSGSFANAAERCFGVGKCRSLGGHTMCPSFQATREERYSTRGRAHLLFEMMRGDAITDGWRDDGVREALDLCLQCKGCKSDCPVSVDMATYKAEFLAHYYKGRLRPRAAYAMGLVMWWAPLAMAAPGLVNLALRIPGLGDGVKALAGFTREREAPAFAAQSFQDWFRNRPRGPEVHRPPVILWPDTFNNYFLPGTAKAAVGVLEDAGYRVEVPQARLCCGRPLYDYGMLDLAKRKLRQVIDALRPAIRAGVPVVGLEPSCLSVFRDELVNLFPDDPDAQRLCALSKTLCELLGEREDWHPPPLAAKALVQVHCHHRAVLDTEAQQRLFAAMAVEQVPNGAGCCGQAGSFGYEAEHYPVAMTIAEQTLLPAVRKAGDDTLIVADGFSCREQIRHGTGRYALHPAELVALALQRRPVRSAHAVETRLREKTALPGAGAAAAAALAIGGLVWLGMRRRPAAPLQG
ncbi:MAG TPA: FAD-binding and (Fe-S)-binding domain-containing protein [Stellaceae bacterium]|nr:FAD-binding and (Fe-S)-binding domain-containing protein [Stellaceae bacterium]